jgi:hypothetical protein
METSIRQARKPSGARKDIAAIMCAAMTLCIPVAGRATEGGIGRPLTGMQVTPYAGIVPPTSDWIFSITTIYYEGSLGTSRTIPVAGTVTAGLNYHVSYTLLNAVKTWGVTLGGWNFATQFADILFTPVVAGYHLTKTDHIALSVQMYAPTGAYSTSRLANAGQNTWTFIPTIAYTKLLPEHNIELSANYGVEIYTPNDKTHYHNAPLSVLDLLALKRFTSGWGVGVVGGWIQQIGDDAGGEIGNTAGANGHAIGVGPIVTYAGKVSGTPVSASLRWVNEFEVLNRPKGNAVELSISATFQ